MRKKLVSIGSPLGEGQIYDSNRYTIHGMLTRMGFDIIDMGVVRDDPALLEQAFRDAAAVADVVITSGGVSVGEADFVKVLLNKLGEARRAMARGWAGRPEDEDRLAGPLGGAGQDGPKKRIGLPGGGAGLGGTA